jgi:hypothetical protein
MDNQAGARTGGDAAHSSGSPAFRVALSVAAHRTKPTKVKIPMVMVHTKGPTKPMMAKIATTVTTIAAVSHIAVSRAVHRRGYPGLVIERLRDIRTQHNPAEAPRPITELRAPTATPIPRGVVTIAATPTPSATFPQYSGSLRAPFPGGGPKVRATSVALAAFACTSRSSVAFHSPAFLARLSVHPGFVRRICTKRWAAARDLKGVTITRVLFAFLTAAGDGGPRQFFFFLLPGHASTPLAAPADPGLPVNGSRHPDSPTTNPRRGAGAAPRNRPGAVTYLKSADHTLRGESGGSRLGGHGAAPLLESAPFAGI